MEKEERLQYELREKNEKTLQELMRRHEREIFLTVRSVTGGRMDWEDIQEVVNDAFYQLWTHASSLSPDKGTVRAYLVKTACNLARNKMREKKIRTYSILVSVEPLNEKSGQVIENGSAFPVVNPAGNYQITAEKELRDGKRYYLIEMPSDEDTCSILFHPLLAGTDANETWMKAHKEEVLTLEFSVQPKAGEVIAISPGSVGEGAEYHSLTLSFMGIKGEASVKRKGDFPIPRVTAVMADGSQICLVEGNMGTQGKEEKLLCGSESCGGGFTGEGNHKQGSMKYEKIYEDFLDLRSVEKVFVNGVESWSR